MDNHTVKLKCGCEIPIIDGKIHIDYDNLNDKCKKTWKLYCDGYTRSIFQLESRICQTWSKELKPESLKDAADLIAIIRPGVGGSSNEDGVSMTKVFCNRKNEKDIYDKSNTLSKLLLDTYGIMIYQEDLMKISKILASFDGKMSNKLVKCLSPNSIVYTNLGPRELSKINNGTKILSIKNNKLFYSKIKKIWKSGFKKLYRLSTVNGFQVEATDDHKIMTNHGWKELKDITEKDFVIIPRKYKYSGRSISTEEVILVSYFISEGCYTPKSSRPKITNQDQNVIDLIKKCTASLFGEESYHIYKQKNGVMDFYFKGDARKYFQKNFDKVKSAEKDIPDKYVDICQENSRVFIGCYFNAEGSVGKNNLEITSASKVVIKKLQAMLLRDEIFSSISIKYNKKYKRNYYRLHICKRSDITIFYQKHNKYICKEKNIKIETLLSKSFDNKNYSSYKIPENFVSSSFGSLNLNNIVGKLDIPTYKTSLTLEKANRLNKLIGSEEVQELLNAEYYYVQVKKIEELEESDVYDFETTDDVHCGIVDGVLVHNSVGKKDAELLFSLETKFVEGCVKTGTISKDEAIEIFEQIKASARYLFGKCICPSTVIETPDEIKTIDEVNIGEFINSPDGFIEVLDKFETGVKDLYEVELESGEKIKCTLEHKLLCDDKNTYTVSYIMSNCLRVVTEENTASVIKSIKYLGKQRTCDITVNSKNHIYYGNGIATSNSHSYGYAIVGYQTAWVKAHFPHQYICAWLKISKSEQKPLEEIRAMMSEARRLKIKVYGPSARNLPKTDFFINDDCVYFGLSSIKGCSADAYDKLIEAAPDFKKITWTDFLINYSPLLSKSQVIPMCQTGCFDDFSLKSRLECEFEFNQFNTLTPAQKKKAAEFYDPSCDKNLIDVLTKYSESSPKLNKVKQIIQCLQFPPMDLKDSKQNMIKHEKELLGINITSSNIQRAAIPSDVLTCKALNNLKYEKYKTVSVAGEITSFQEFKIKNGKMVGQTMANLKLSDHTEEIDVVVFPSALDQFQSALYDGNIVLIKGTQSNRGGLILNEIYEV